jgi:hypothetical protein
MIDVSQDGRRDLLFTAPSDFLKDWKLLYQTAQFPSLGISMDWYPVAHTHKAVFPRLRRIISAINKCLRG